MMDKQPLGTAREEFDAGTGYWRKWQRCEEEKAEMEEVIRYCYELASNSPLVDPECPELAYDIILDKICYKIEEILPEMDMND